MTVNVRILHGALALLAGALLLAAQTAAAQSGPMRIVVLPFYTEKGADVTDSGYEGLHYRRIIRFINNQLVRHKLEVMSPDAIELKEADYNRLRKTPREDSLLAATEMTRKYAVDVVYIVWLNVSRRVTDDGYCRAEVKIEGEGYNSAARAIGAGMDKTFTHTSRDCEKAIRKAEKEAGDQIGRILGDRLERSGAHETGTSGGSDGPVDPMRGLINMRLEGATEYELVEVFGKVLHTVRGVTEASVYGITVDPENPQASLALWRVRVEDTTTFRLQANVMTMLKSICKAGGELVLNGVVYRYSPAEVELLKGVFPYRATPGEIAFRVDRERVRDQEMRGVECWG